MNLALVLRRTYWWLFRPNTRGVRALLVNSNGEVLLVKHSYGKGWYLPGGKIGRNEDDLTALRRELSEELGIGLNGNARKLGEYKNNQEYKRDTIVVFVVESYTQGSTKDLEIEMSKFFKPETLPEDISPGTRKRIEEWLGTRKIGEDW